jgi:hypothetical protein
MIPDARLGQRGNVTRAAPGDVAPDEARIWPSAAYGLGMHRLLGAVAIAVMAISVAGCGGGSVKASRGCFEIWNDGSNKAAKASVIGRFSVASVTEWRAEAGRGSVNVEWRAAPGSGTVKLGGPGSKGCGYLFHSSKRFLSISALRKGESVRWDVPPSIHGRWSRQQQAAARDNASVAADGHLSRRH